MPVAPSVGIASKPSKSDESVCTAAAPFAGNRVPGGTTMLPVPVTFVVSFPAPDFASAFVLTSAAGRGENAYGTVHVTALLTGQVPSAVPLSSEPVSARALAEFGLNV